VKARRSPKWSAAALVVAAISWSGSSIASPAPPERSSESKACNEPQGGTRALAIGASIAPGVLLHGSGHYVMQDKQTARRLLAVEGAGLGMIVVGGVPIVITGASRYLVGPAAGLTVLGMGLFSMSLFSDIYGVSVPASSRGEVPLTVPVIESQLGYRYVYDPLFAYRNFVVHGFDLRHGAWRLSPSAWHAIDDRNERWRVMGAYRFIGPRTPGFSSAKTASFLEVEAGWTRHAFLTEGFGTGTAEVSLAGRWDLQQLDPKLKGAFWDFGAGVGFHTIDYGLRGVPNETSALLMARFGFGAWIGRGARKAGEVSTYYDHRHDDYAAGMKIPGLGAGVAGHIGFSGKVYLTENFGLVGVVEGGSAWLGGLSIAYRSGQ